MRKFLSILMVLALVTALFVSCSQDKVGNVVGEDLVSISFATGDSSRTLTVSREAFDENDYIWCYTAVKADNSGMTQGETIVGGLITEAYVWGDDHTKTGLTGATIEGISQGLWNFTLSAYVPTYDAQGHITGKSDVKAWAGSVTNQPVKKGEANVVNVTVSAVVDPEKNGMITFQNVVVRKLNGSDVTAPAIWTGDKDLILGVKATTLAGVAVDGAFVEYKKGEGHTTSNIPEPKFEVAAGTYFVTFKAYEGTFDKPTFVYAEETIAVNVYSGLRTIISGFVSELSSYVQFGEPVANAVIEAQTNSVINVDPEGPDVEFKPNSTQSTSSYQAASITAEAVYAIKEAVDVPEESTLTDLALALNVKDEGSTDASATTTKKFDISLDAIVTTTNQTSGAVSVDTQSVGELEDIMVIALYIGKNLTIQEVWHDNTQLYTTPGASGEFYLYDLDEGILTLNVNHFSPFSVIYEKEVAVARLIKADGTGADFYTLEEAVDAAVAGDTVKFLKDITLPATATAEDDRFTISEDITIDFGTYKLIAPGSLEPTSNWAALWITRNVVFEGTTGGIDCLDKQDGCGPYGVNIKDNGTLTVNGGVYHGGGTVIQVTLGKLYINGGTFTATPFEEPYVYDFTINCKDSAYQAGTAKVVIRGGLFDHFNPADNKSEGENTDYVPADCLVEEIGDGWYKVTPLTLVEAKDSNCFEEGFHTHWEDSDGNEYIVDGNARRPATGVDLIIPTHHYWVYESRSESPDANGKYSVTYKCQACNETKVVDGWTLVQFENNTSETPVNLWSDLEPLTKTDLSGKKTIFELGEGLYTVRSTGGKWVSPKECYLRTECIIVGSGSESTTIQISNDSWWLKGIQLYNRYMKESGIPQSNFQFAGLTIEDTSADASKDSHLLLITSYGVELGLNDVTFKGFKGTTNVGFWANQTLSDGKYPTKADAQGIYISLKDVEFVDTVKPFIQNQSFTAANIAGQSDCYSSVHLLVDGSVGDLTLASQTGNNIHDGIHTEWFVNGNIVRVPGTVGLYGMQ